MKNRLFSLFVVVFFLFSGITTYGQSVSGNMNAGSSLSLGYGNVNIYQGENLIASLLTDKFGNFDVKLDTGFYRVELNYEGYEKMIREIHVTGDEKGDFRLSESKELSTVKYKEKRSVRSSVHADYIMESEARSIASSPMTSGGALRSYSPTTHAVRAKIENSGQKGVLTSGEINDFAKWEMWKDLSSGELSGFKKKYDLYFEDRYTVQLKDKKGFPIVRALVQLIDNDEVIRFQSRTDVTGKAELWGKMGINDASLTHPSAKIFYQGMTYSIQRLNGFSNGVNTLEIEAECGVSNVVDIAFVVDATGSMQDEIDYLKEDLNEVIFRAKNEHKELVFNFANVFYRDHGDEYLTRTQDFTDVLSTAVDFISKQNANGGGDYEEAVEIALQEALDSLSWTEDARARLLFLVLDAPPHATSEILQQMKDIIHKAASIGVRIVPITGSGISKDAEYLMRSLALGTNGTYAFLTNDSGIGGDHIKPSTDAYEVELLNDLLIRIITSSIEVWDCNYEIDEVEILKEEQEDMRADNKLEIWMTWEIWPNPTSDRVKMKIGANVDELFLTDVSGKILKRFTNIKKDRELVIPLQDYATGIYLLTFTDKEKVYTKKVVKK